MSSKRIVINARKKDSNILPINIPQYDIKSSETDEQIHNRIAERFEVLAELTEAVVFGDARALIVSGPPGLGKTHTIEKIVSNNSVSFTHETGFVRATGLYKLLYAHQTNGSVLIMDDADSIFGDVAALSLLKAACDTTEKRNICWRAETNMTDDNGVILPTSFEFNGSMIFISNQDFDANIQNGTAFSEHMEAMISRAHYIDLSLKSRRDYLIRIKQVIYGDKMLYDVLEESEINKVVGFIEDNLKNLREVSLRMAIKISSIMRAHPEKWERICRVTCCRY